MEVHVSGHHFNVSDKLKEYAEEKFSRIGRFFQAAHKVEIILKDEDRKKHCEALIRIKNRDHLVIDVAREHMYEAIDLAVDKAERQLRRLKEKTQSHRRKNKARVEQDAASAMEAGDE